MPHPERKVNFSQVQFFPDGSKLLGAGYPSGIVQIWDVASKKEMRRIDTTRGYRGSSEYALLTPDWKTLYVPVQNRAVKSFERDGKRLRRIEYSGEMRVWDVATGKEKDALRSDAGWAPDYSTIVPGGRYLLSTQMGSYEVSTKAKATTILWDLTSGKNWKIADDFAHPVFFPDGKKALVGLHGADRESLVKLLELPSGKELAAFVCPEKERHFTVGSVAADGSVVAIMLGGKTGAPAEVWFRDGTTLADRGKLITRGDPEGHGWGHGLFTPDGKHFVMLDGVANVHVWDVAGQKVERILPTGGDRSGWKLAFSPDGKTLAVGWIPRSAEEKTDEPDPLDMPQPRVSLIDLTGKTPPRILIAPHGYVGGLAFSPDGQTLAFGSGGAVHLFQLSK